MRILFVHNRYLESGGEHVVSDRQIELLSAAGHTLEVVETSNREGLAGAGQFMMAPWNPFAASRVTKAALSFQPDLALVHNTWFALSPSVLRALENAGIPTAMVLHNFRLTCANGLLFRQGEPCQLCVGRSPLPGVRHRCYRGLGGSIISAATIQSWRTSGVTARSVDAFIVFSDWMREVMTRSGLEASKIHVLPHSTDDSGPRRVPPSESRDVVYVGRLSPEKGILDLVRRWSSVSGGLHLVVAGDGPDRGAILEAASQADVTYMGGIDRAGVVELMHRSRCLVMPSESYESFGLVAIESMAAALPVIVTKVVPLSNAVRSSLAGWVVSSESDWADILRQCSDDSEVDARGANARRLYERDYTPEINLRGLETLFSSLVGVD